MTVIRYTIYNWEPPLLSEEGAAALAREISSVGQDKFSRALKSRLSVPAEHGGPKPFTFADVCDDARTIGPSGSPIVGLIVFILFVGGIVWGMLAFAPVLLIPLFIIGGISLGSLYWMRRKIDRWVQNLVEVHARGRTMLNGVLGPGVETAPDPHVSASDAFEIAGGEVLSGKVKAGLWARALVEGGDNDSATRAAYVRYRVAELKGEATF